jgi:hypothetical protein
VPAGPPRRGPAAFAGPRPSRTADHRGVMGEGMTPHRGTE